MIHFEDVTKVYRTGDGEVRALSGVNLDVERGGVRGGSRTEWLREVDAVDDRGWFGGSEFGACNDCR